MHIEELDSDGALREAADEVAGTRAGFLAKAAVAAGGLTGGGAVLGALPSVAGAATKGDVSILNFALTLEYLEAAFYERALRSAGLRGEELRFAKVAGSHERTHVAALRKALGSKAIAKPAFDFGASVASRAAFLRTAILLEDTGVAAYKGQAARIKDETILKSALAIHSVEAKHAAWVRFLAGVNPGPKAVDRPLSRKQVLDAVKATGFIR